MKTLAMAIVMCAAVGMGQTKKSTTLDSWPRPEKAEKLLDIIYADKNSVKCEAKHWPSTVGCMITAVAALRVAWEHWEIPPTPAPQPILGDEAQGYQVVQLSGTAGRVSNSVPVAQVVNDTQTGFRTTLEYRATDSPAVMLDSNGHMAVSDSFTGTVSVPSKTGRIDRLSDEEYARLQGTPMKDYEAEKRKVALAHGVDFGDPGHACTSYSPISTGFGLPFCDSKDERPFRLADEWWIHGQWLGVNTGFVPQGVGR